MTRGEGHAVAELAGALDQPCDKDMLGLSLIESLGIDGAACEFLEDDDGLISINCHKVRLGVARERFVYYDAAMAYLQALGVRDEN